MRSNKGYTLIEMLIVVAIIGILFAIAMPNYSDYVTRSKITEAISGLSDMRVRMEQYYQDNRTYAGACVAGTVAPIPASTTNFDFACDDPAVPGAATYTITANGRGSMTGFRYQITQANVRSTATTAAAAWPSITNAACWSMKRDGSC